MNRQTTLSAALLALLLTLASCSMMQEDRSNCPDCRNPLHVKLRYDYNTQRANMFPDHVEQATVYVVDAASGVVVDQQTAQNTVYGSSVDNTAAAPLRDPSFGFNFEGLSPGRYRLYATGRSAAELPFVTTVPAIDDAMSKLQFAVPTGADGQVPAQRLDTVWNTLKAVEIELPEREPTEATVPLMRLTNDLNVIVFRRDGKLENGHNQYDVTVTDRHPIVTMDNQTGSDEQTISYRPFAAWTTETTVNDHDDSQAAPRRAGEGVVVERNAHYDLSLGRLVAHDDARRNARLIIRNRTTGHEVVNIDLLYYLSLARNAFEYEHYSQQEFLDREYDYRLDFGFDGNGPDETWRYMYISINVLSWSLRIQNEDL